MKKRWEEAPIPGHKWTEEERKKQAEWLRGRERDEKGRLR
jgi:hypothetical protein